MTGEYNENSGRGAVIGGCNNVNTHDRKAVFGYYNEDKSDTLFEVGNGNGIEDDANERRNAFEVHSDGRATVGANPTSSLDVTPKQYVDNIVFNNISYHVSLEPFSTEIDYDKWNIILSPANVTITFKSISNDFLPEYKGTITVAGASGSIVVTFPTGTTIITNDSNITISNNEATIPNDTVVEFSIVNKKAILFNFSA